jgi:hypothetical protein
MCNIPVYCLMVTGYVPERIQFAKSSLRNFFQQTYNNKHLIIINQSKNEKIVNEDFDNVIEVFVERDTIGKLRNLSLEFVPPNAIWTTWDDDDYRSQSYLQVFMNYFQTNNIDFLMFSNRLEYNILNGHRFRVKLNSGTSIFFCKRTSIVHYDNNKHTMEDIVVKKHALKNFKYKIIDNDPKLYIRLIHDNNTSKYCDPTRTKVRNTKGNVDFLEFELSHKELKYMNEIISTYYKRHVLYVRNNSKTRIA